MFDLDQILKTNQLDANYNILFELLRNHQGFNLMDHNTIQITVQKTVLSLARAMYISCTILNNRRTSIFRHQVALIKDNTLHFQEDKLHSLNLSELIHPNKV